MFLQGVAWFAGIPGAFDSPIALRKWTQELLTKLYRCLGGAPPKLSDRTKVVVTLRQTGSSCENKTVPGPYYPELIPNRYDLPISLKLWNQPLDIIRQFIVIERSSGRCQRTINAKCTRPQVYRLPAFLYDLSCGEHLSFNVLEWSLSALFLDLEKAQ